MTQVGHVAYQSMRHDKQIQYNLTHRCYLILSRVTDLNVFVTMMTSYDLYGGHRLATALDSLPNRIGIVTDS